MHVNRWKRLLVTVLALSLESGAIAQEHRDPAKVYRLQPTLKQAELREVPAEEIKPGLAYNYFHQGLRRWAWGFAAAGGGLEYVFGVDTMLPTTRFDLRLSEQSQAEILNLRAPGLKDTLATVGRSPSVRLTAEGNWELLPYSVGERVFDVETGRRWEWHGKRRVAVMHVNGYLWEYAAGNYRPVFILAMPCY